jgi:5-methylcytosine-specific restriction enzyme A
MTEVTGRSTLAKGQPVSPAPEPSPKAIGREAGQMKACGQIMARLPMLKGRVDAVRARVAPPVKLADPFYLSAEWRVFAKAIKSQRGYACEAEGCGFDGRGREWLIHADHVIEIRDGGARLDPLNVMLRCQGCHNRKTAAEAARRAREG